MNKLAAVALVLVTSLACLSGCAGATRAQAPARAVSILTDDQLRAMSTPPGDEMEMQFEAPVRKERKALDLADRVAPEKIEKPAIAADKIFAE